MGCAGKCVVWVVESCVCECCEWVSVWWVSVFVMGYASAVLP